MKFTQQQILEISKGDADIASFISALLETLEKHEHRILELERQLNQHSNNSSKPPSSDGLRKPNNSRQPGGKIGAPKGHKGHTHYFHPYPDNVVVHPLTVCKKCNCSLADVPVTSYSRRQVFDLPLSPLVTTEHQAEEGYCPCCQTLQKADFPVSVKAPVQYGDSFAAWTAYLSTYQLLPLKRIAQFFFDLTGYRPSQQTLLSQLKTMERGIAEVEPIIKAQLRLQPFLCCDETPMRLNGKRQYLHTHSTAEWTLLHMSSTRCGPAFEEMGILLTYLGIVVHDCFSSYFKDGLTFLHQLCNAHHLRDLQGIVDHDHHRWAAQMKELLGASWKMAKEARSASVPLAEEVITQIYQQYDEILGLGKTEWSKDAIPEKTGPRGRKSKSRAANLGERFECHKESILRFLRDDRIPFDNNQAERDIRMSKVKLKISGCFRTSLGGQMFARIRGFISTLIKQSLPLYDSLVAVLRGQFQFRTT